MKHISMGYEITTLTIRYRLDDIIKWWHSRTVDDGEFMSDTAADLGMVGYNHFDGDDLDWEMADYESPTRTVDTEDTVVHSNGDLDMTISYRQEMVARQNPSIELVDVIHSWMMDCLGNGARPKNEEWRDMTVMADLCNYNRRIVGFYRGQTSMTPVTGYLHQDSDVWVEVEWITEDHDAQRKDEQDRKWAHGYDKGLHEMAAKYRATGVFGWQCLVSNCAAINMFTGDVASTNWHNAEAWCRVCNQANVLLPKWELEKVNSDTSRDAGFDHLGRPYTGLIPFLISSTDPKLGEVIST